MLLMKETFALTNWERYLPADGVPKWYAARRGACTSESSSMRLMACSREVMGEMANIGWLDFGGRVERCESSTTAPLSPWVTTFVFQDLLSCRDLKASAMGEVFLESLFEPLAALLEPARKRIECVNTCSRNSFLMNSFTSTTSGAYGEEPPNANRAVTSCSAADAKSAVRSTMAMTLLLDETSCEYVGFLTCDSWRTWRLVERSSDEGLDEMIANVSDSIASDSSLRSSDGRARRLFSSY